jgi:hypothetical protein
MALFEQTTMFAPGPYSAVDPEKETVEGRVGKLLETDDRGNYTHQFVRQAQTRQEQAFNNRGLLNTSMAQQAAQEAAISKAAEIAAPDARTEYDNRRANIDQGVKVRADYRSAQHDIETNFQRQLDTINASQMTPEDKSVAVAQAQSVRDGEMAFQNNLFSRMPDWREEWLTAVVPTSGINMGQVGNRDTLSNIVNDPGQSQAIRDQAAQRLRDLDGGAGTDTPYGMIGQGNAGQSAVNGYRFPSMIPGVGAVNWDDAPFGRRDLSLRAQYEAYARTAGPAAMLPEQWLAANGNSLRFGSGLGGSVEGPGPGDGGASSAGVGVGVGDSGGTSGI